MACEGKGVCESDRERKEWNQGGLFTSRDGTGHLEEENRYVKGSDGNI